MKTTPPVRLGPKKKIVVPDFSKYSRLERARIRAQIEYKMGLKIASNPKLGLKMPTPETKLDELYVTYMETCQNVDSISTSSLGKMGLALIWVSIEAFCAYKEIPASGFAQNQAIIMKGFEGLINELGQDIDFDDGTIMATVSAWPTYVKVGLIALINILVFFFIKWMGSRLSPQAQNQLQNETNSFLKLMVGDGHAIDVPEPQPGAADAIIGLIQGNNGLDKVVNTVKGLMNMFNPETNTSGGTAATEPPAPPRRMGAAAPAAAAAPAPARAGAAGR